MIYWQVGEIEQVKRAENLLFFTNLTKKSRILTKNQPGGLAKMLKMKYI